MALIHTDFFSDALGMCVEMDVILPEETKGQIGMEGRDGKGGWKTLYLLHGMSDDHTIWQRRTSIERYASEKGIAVVMPSTQLGWYTDMHCGYKWFTYISEELPRVCRAFFPRMSHRREDTFACGLSMGGYGALKLALRAPETFSCAASLSGGVDIVHICEQTSLADDHYWEDIFGQGIHVVRHGGLPVRRKRAHARPSERAGLRPYLRGIPGRSPVEILGSEGADGSELAAAGKGGLLIWR